MSRRLPLIVTLAVAAVMLLHGPIAQLPHYHEFADGRAWLGIPNAANVLSNLGFAVVGLYGLLRVTDCRYRLFLSALVLTAVGSGFYHWAPDESRLVWDRLAIALACAGLIAGVRSQTRSEADAGRWSMLLSLVAIASVVWGVYTGDLRPYLLLQALAVLLVPLWQWMARAPAADRQAFGLGIGLCVLAKLAEINDNALMALLHGVSGHALKHLLATAAAAVIVGHLVRRTEAPALAQAA